jgi:hypothetical protein
MKNPSNYATFKKPSASHKKYSFPKTITRINFLLSREYCPFKDIKFNNGLPSTVPNIRDSARPAAGEPKKKHKNYLQKPSVLTLRESPHYQEQKTENCEIFKIAENSFVN